MDRGIKPQNISPFIRGARIIFLLCGIPYGMMKFRTFKAIEATAKPKRDSEIAEEHRLAVIEDAKRTKTELVNLVKDFELPDVPEGWENDI